MSRNVPTIALPPQLKSHLAAGHPWVYRDHVPANVRLPSGSWVRLQSGSWSGYALWDARSPIAARVYSATQVPDAAWIAERVRIAWEGRAALRQTPTSAYRVLFGEGDGLPGVTVDLYGAFAALATYADSVETVVPDVVAALRRVMPGLRGVVRRRQIEADPAAVAPGDHSEAGGKIEALWGDLPPRDLVVEENGLRFVANLYEGQKTGLFLDHRDNRRTVEQWSAGRRVLNCFSYTGAFSLYAARGGAASTVSVDIAPAASEDAAANFRLNGLDGGQHAFLARDCFDYLHRVVQRGERFDLVILDPPSFARAKKNIHAATRAYVKLNALAIRCVAPDGLLASASCTSQLAPAAFRAMLGEAAASADRRLSIIHEAGHALDHPVPAHFMEGRYLKFALARVLDIA